MMLEPRNELTTIFDIFINNVRKYPERPAVILHAFLKDAGNRVITYRELNEYINLISDKLITAGVLPGSTIGVHIKPSIELIASIFSIWKLNCTYLPLSLELSVERLQYICDDSCTSLLITDSNIAVKSTVTFNIVNLSAIEVTDHNAQDQFLQNNPSPEIVPAYIIYTSGSTGKPKGVLVSHKSLMNTMEGLQTEFPFSEDSTFLVKSMFCFDASFIEFLWPLLYGCKIVLLDYRSTKNPDDILSAIKVNNVTHTFFVPSMLAIFLSYAKSKLLQLASLSNIFIGGEILPPNLVKQIKSLGLESIRLVNLYGPTESGIISTFYDVKQWSGYGSIPIGKPLHNMRAFVTNDKLEAVNEGDWGELCVTGESVAIGYLNRSDLNKERFVISPLADGKVYRTGDIVRVGEDGNLYFQGRQDNQIKIRGYRVELGEIESALFAIPEVTAAAVISIPFASDSHQLIAYYKSDQQLSINYIRRCLINSLPEYMVPYRIEFLDKTLVTSSGKLDRKALSDMALQSLSQNSNTTSNISDKDKLLQIWVNILGIDYTSIDLDANFFNLGGNSLGLIQMATKVQDEFSVIIPFDIFLQNITINSLSNYLKQVMLTNLPGLEANNYKCYNLSSAQMRMYLLYLKEKSSLKYNVSGLIKLTGLLDKEKLRYSLNYILNRHASLRTSFETGKNGLPVQVVHSSSNLLIDEFESTNLQEAKEKFLKFKVGFDLSRLPLIKFYLCRIVSSEMEHLLFFDADHIIFDGYSIGILTDELTEIYHDNELPSIKYDYIDFAVYENSSEYVTRLNEKKIFWQDYLKNFKPANLPHDHYQRDMEMSMNYVISNDLCKKIDQVCKQYSMTRFALTLLAFNLTLFSETLIEDATIAVAFSNRNLSVFNTTIGNFINIFLFRNRIRMDDSITTLLPKIMQNLKGSIQHGDYPYQALYRDILSSFSGDEKYNISILINHFSYSDKSDDRIHEQRLKCSFDNIEIPSAKYDLSLYIFDKSDEISLNLVYKSPLFSSVRIAKFTEKLGKVINLLANDPKVKVSEAIECNINTYPFTKDEIIDDEFEAF